MRAPRRRPPQLRQSGITTRVAGASIAVALLGAASGCSGDPTEAYCEEVQAQQTPLTEAAASGATGLLQALPSFEVLRDKAPDDIADDWVIVVQRVTVLRAALDEAGVDPTSYDPEEPPADLSEQEQAAIAAAATGLLTDAMVTALGSVQQHARDVCKTPLTL